MKSAPTSLTCKANAANPRFFLLVVALSTGLSFGSPAFADVGYYQLTHSYILDLNSGEVNRLGTLGGYHTHARAINDLGQVVGGSTVTMPADPYADAPTHAFITGPDGAGMTDLGTLGGNNSEAVGINAAGQAVGWSDTSTGSRHAYITRPSAAGMKDLGTLGGDNSEANSINAAGQAVGWSDTSTGSRHAFITGPNGAGMTDLGTLGGRNSEAIGINTAGQVVGWSDTSTGYQHAFITGPGGVGMTDLGVLGGNYSKATSINDAGQVVGGSTTGGTTDWQRAIAHAFITGPNGVGMTDLGALPGDSGFSEAYGINDAGEVVGWSESRTYDAFISVNGMGMTSLATPPYWFRSAADINNAGQVLAIIPEPETYAMFLAGLGLMGFIARRRNIN